MLFVFHQTFSGLHVQGMALAKDSLEPVLGPRLWPGHRVTMPLRDLAQQHQFEKLGVTRQIPAVGATPIPAQGAPDGSLVNERALGTWHISPSQLQHGPSCAETPELVTAGESVLLSTVCF